MWGASLSLFVFGGVGVNSEPNKRLRLTPPLAPRGAGIGIAADGAAAARRGTPSGRSAHSTDWL